MKTSKYTAAQIADMEPEALLKNFATFPHYQLLGKCLDYNPTINESLGQLQDWEYEQVDDDEKKLFDRWAKASTQAAPAIWRNIQSAGTSLWGDKNETTYSKLLTEIKDKLELGILSQNSTYAEREQIMLKYLLEEALKKLESLPDSKKEKMNEDLWGFLAKQGIARTSTPAVDYLKGAAGAGVGALVGTQIATGIILAHLGVVNGLLFAVGLYSIPTFLIGGAIFAPLMGLYMAYVLGQHNFKKTIPCMAIIASIRQEAMERYQPVQLAG